jgi:hypothetical protein
MNNSLRTLPFVLLPICAALNLERLQAQSTSPAGSAQGAAATPPCTTPTFTNPHFQLGGVVRGADLDHDGHLDLVGLRYGYGYTEAHEYGPVVVTLNRGDGFYDAPVVYASGYLTWPLVDLVTADFSGDGYVDVAVADSADRIFVLLNQGNGTFAPYVPYEVGPRPTSLTSADFDGDGDVDLAVALYSQSPNMNSVTVLLNQGDGTFALSAGYGVGSNPASITNADLDNDGDLDLVTANYLGHTLSVLLNEGSGTFAAHVAHPVAPYPQHLMSADLDGDGRVDLACSNGGSNVISVVWNQGNGVLAAPTQYGVPAGGPIAAVDLNGDRQLELMCTNVDVLEYTLSTLWNQGNRSFAPPMSRELGRYPHSVAGVDLDEDSDTDLICAGNGTSAALMNRGGGVLQTHAQYPLNTTPFSVAHGDFDIDGDIDLAATTQSSDNLTILSNRGDGSIESRVALPLNLGATCILAMESADLNADGLTDLAGIDCVNNRIPIILNQGDGTFAAHGEQVTASSLTAMTLADLDGDDDVDVACTSRYSHSAEVLLNHGDGTFDHLGVSLVGITPIAITSSDLDGDGDVDLAIVNVGHGTPLSVYLNHGDGTFAQPAAYILGNVYDDEAWITSADFDGDGDGDLAVLNSHGNVAVLSNQGDGTFVVQSNHQQDFPSGFESADLDADGDVDLVIATQWRSITIFRNPGNGSFSEPEYYSTTQVPYDLTIADLDGNGYLDVASADRYDGTVTVLLNACSCCGTIEPYCFGDGSLSSCPCGNQGGPGRGCANSVHPRGALLQATGTASVSGDTVILQGTDMPDGACMYFQGTGQASFAFGDGLRCVVGNIIRLETTTNSAGMSQYPAGGAPSVSVRGAVPPAGGTRNYQTWYRNAASFCTPFAHNSTNGVEIVWTP